MMQNHKHKEVEHSHASTVKVVYSNFTWEDTTRDIKRFPHDFCTPGNGNYEDCMFDDGAGGISTNSTVFDPKLDVTLTNAKATCGAEKVDTDDTDYRVGEETRPV